MAEPLLSLNYSGLPTRLKSYYVSRLINVIHPVLSSNPFITSIGDKINVELENIKKITTRGKSSSYTKIILEKDKKRDKVFTGVLNLIKSKRDLCEDPLEIRASEVLLHAFGKLEKNVVNLSYSRETIQLKALFKEFEVAEVSSAINTLGINTEIQKLINSQKDFEEALSNRVSELSVLDGKKSLDAHRTLSFHFLALMEHIGYNIIEEVSPFTELTFPLNQIIAEANSVANRSDDSDENDDSKDEPAETETIAE